MVAQGRVTFSRQLFKYEYIIDVVRTTMCTSVLGLGGGAAECVK